MGNNTINVNLSRQEILTIVLALTTDAFWAEENGYSAETKKQILDLKEKMEKCM